MNDFSALNKCCILNCETKKKRNPTTRASYSYNASIKKTFSRRERRLTSLLPINKTLKIFQLVEGERRTPKISRDNISNCPVNSKSLKIPEIFPKVPKKKKTETISCYTNYCVVVLRYRAAEEKRRPALKSGLR